MASACSRGLPSAIAALTASPSRNSWTTSTVMRSWAMSTLRISVWWTPSGSTAEPLAVSAEAASSLPPALAWRSSLPGPLTVTWLPPPALAWPPPVGRAAGRVVTTDPDPAATAGLELRPARATVVPTAAPATTRQAATSSPSGRRPRLPEADPGLPDDRSRFGADMSCSPLCAPPPRRWQPNNPPSRSRPGGAIGTPRTRSHHRSASARYSSGHRRSPRHVRPAADPPLPEEGQDAAGQGGGGPVVGVVGAGDLGQLAAGEQPGGGLGPGQGDDRLPGPPGHQRRPADQGQLGLDRVAQGVAQGGRDPPGTGVADVAGQDRQLQWVLAGGVPQPAHDLARRRPGRRVDGRADQDQGGDPVGEADGQLHGDLAAERVAEHHHRGQPGGVDPGGQVDSVAGHVQGPTRVAAETEPGQVDDVHRVEGGQLGRHRHQVAVGDGQPVDQDQGRCGPGAAGPGAVVGVDPEDRPPVAPEPEGVTGRAGGQPVPVEGAQRPLKSNGSGPPRIRCRPGAGPAAPRGHNRPWARSASCPPAARPGGWRPPSSGTTCGRPGSGTRGPGRCCSAPGRPRTPAGSRSR